MDFLNYFNDHKLTPREGQVEILENLNRNWEDYDYHVIEAPTGTGKSYIALAIADAMKAYLLTSTKMLQTQYEEMSSAKVVSIRGRGNYTCNIDPAFTVDIAPCLADKKLKSKCLRQNSCSYYRQRKLAADASNTLMNYSYFMAATQSIEGIDEELTGSLWHSRDSIIMDEAHELEDILVSAAEVNIDFDNLYESYGLGQDEWKVSVNKEETLTMIRFIVSKAGEKIADYYDKLTELSDEYSNSKDKKLLDKIKKINAKMNDLFSHYIKLTYFLETREDEEWVESEDFDENSFSAKPLYCSGLFDYFIAPMADKFVFMSATIGSVDVYAKELGIDRSQINVIKVDSPFDSAKSPVVMIPAAKLNYKEIQNNLPIAAEVVGSLLDMHPDDKGIIHSGNYAVNEGIWELVDQKHKSRLLHRNMHDDIRRSNEDLFKMHSGTNSNTVLMSPSMHTGISLDDELSRFQIIVKLPFLSLGDDRIKRKSEIDSNWYLNKMWLTVIQAAGRSTRSESDESVTYILDKSAPYFLDKWRHNLPKDFLARLE